MAERVIRVGMPLADFVDQYNRQPFELVNGEVFVLSPNVAGHQWVAQLVYDLLRTFVQAGKLGFVAFETPFALSESPNWVKGSRTPDLMFFESARWSAYIAATPDWKGKPYLLIPDLAIEVVSPNDRYSEIDDKVEGYLADGVQMVWVIDPQRRKVTVHTSDSDQPLILRQNETLTGGEVLPGFSVAVKSLFE
jgi:Uma2 family endonuclease